VSEPFRKLNAEGMRRFSEFIRGGATGPAPLKLLSNPETSEPLSAPVLPTETTFENRYEFGIYLDELFAPLNAGTISHDPGFWSATALFWFDLICPATGGGSRKQDKEYRYILSADYRHYYRHAVRSPWQLVRTHGELAKFLLVSPKEQEHPLSVHGEILEQLGGRQQILGSRPIISVASTLYYDKNTCRPRTGVAGSGRGSARRFGLVLRQLDLTYDPESMPANNLIALLPSEFDRWKEQKLQPVTVSAAESTIGQAGAQL
jgi:hypothetical protein